MPVRPGTGAGGGAGSAAATAGNANIEPRAKAPAAIRGVDVFLVERRWMPVIGFSSGFDIRCVFWLA
ncbi:hypothetical protein L828_0524 [Mycobacteroides abscessus MAB_030201_1061]|uniref:Uncharacterized protein n=1 Tax=Mycobacteroides abscessus 21 TaxID=1299324 RepID=A0A829Q0Z9_9MYCO|nr:hypothetical protein L828_0524 [Mycobacteroides abscessus MAB_030201_1061]EUA46249.1 hypothetical protein I543_2991 [Mycobacteroides abscessus 21]